MLRSEVHLQTQSIIFHRLSYPNTYPDGHQVVKMTFWFKMNSQDTVHSKWSGRIDAVHAEEPIFLILHAVPYAVTAIWSPSAPPFEVSKRIARTEGRGHYNDRR